MEKYCPREKVHVKVLHAAVLSVMLLLAGSDRIVAQMEEDDGFTEHPTLTNEAAKIYQQNLTEYTNAAEVLVLPGLVAKRSEKRVEVLAESTKIVANETGEYLLIGQNSSHGYEALFWSFAKPSDIHKALEFIGLRAGAPSDPRVNRFWAKGERVVVTVGEEQGAPRIEELIYDTEQEKTLPLDGLIFTGAMVVPNPTNAMDHIYVADEYDPMSIIPAYNEPASVLDVPWQATKGQFYESHVMNPDYPLQPNKMHTIVFEPMDKNGRPTVRDLDLKIGRELDFRLSEKGGDKVLNTNATYESVLQVCGDIIKGGQDPYVTVEFDDSLTIKQIKGLAAALMLIDMPGAIHIDPGPMDRLYYRAFVPNPDWSEHKNRFTQAWEVHISSDKGKLASKMVFYQPEWKDGSIDPVYWRTEFDTPSGEDVRARLDKDTQERAEKEQRQPPPVLLVYAPGDVLYGDLLKYLAPAMKTHSLVHLFLDDDVESSEEEPGNPDGSGASPDNEEKDGN